MRRHRGSRRRSPGRRTTPAWSPRRRPAGRSPTPRCRPTSPAWARRGSASTRATPPRCSPASCGSSRTAPSCRSTTATPTTSATSRPCCAGCRSAPGVSSRSASPAWPHGRAPASRAPRYLAWGALVPLYAISVAVFFVAGRYRLPILRAAGDRRRRRRHVDGRRAAHAALDRCGDPRGGARDRGDGDAVAARARRRPARGARRDGQRAGRPGTARRSDGPGRRDRPRAPRARHRALSRRAGAAGARRSGLRRSRGAPGAVDRSEAAGSACGPRPAARARRPRRRGTPSHAARGGRRRQRRGCRAVDRRRRDRRARDVERGVRGGGGGADGGGRRRHAARASASICSRRVAAIWPSRTSSPSTRGIRAAPTSSRRSASRCWSAADRRGRRRTLERAVSLDGARPSSHLHLAIAYVQIDRPDEALAEARRALALRPDYPQARGVVEALTGAR